MNSVLIAGDAHPDLASDVARLAGVPIVPTSITAFADGETRVVIEAGIRKADVCIVQPTSAPVNARLMTLALLADAARAEGAASIIDKRGRCYAMEPIELFLCGDVGTGYGIDQILRHNVPRRS